MGYCYKHAVGTYNCKKKTITLCTYWLFIFVPIFRHLLRAFVWLDGFEILITGGRKHLHEYMSDIMPRNEAQYSERVDRIRNWRKQTESTIMTHGLIISLFNRILLILVRRVVIKALYDIFEVSEIWDITIASVLFWT